MVQQHPRGAGVRTAPQFRDAGNVDPASLVGLSVHSRLPSLPRCPPFSASRPVSLGRMLPLALNLRLPGPQRVTVRTTTVE
jgi:hypothetical protein